MPEISGDFIRHNYNIEDQSVPINFGPDYSFYLPKDFLDNARIVLSTQYPARHHILIIQEPHDRLDAQMELHNSLNTLFTSYPDLMENMVFLSEGHSQGEKVELSRFFNRISQSKDEEKVKQILGTFSVTGYMTYLWQTENTIPIIGSEDRERYAFSSHVANWIFQEQGVNVPVSELQKSLHIYQWYVAVVSRNKAMVNEVAIQIDKGMNPILFVGGAHLFGLRRQDYLRLMDIADYSMHGPYGQYLSLVRTLDYNRDMIGLVPLLRERGIGFTFLIQNSLIEYPEDVQQYIDTFAIQNGFSANSLIVNRTNYDIEKEHISSETTVSSNEDNAASAVNYIEKKGNIYERQYELYDSDWFSRNKLDVQQRLGRDSLWSNPSSTGRGWDYETLVGANIGGTHPVIDDYYSHEGMATSFKTIDTNALSYQHSKNIYYQGIGYVDNFFNRRFVQQGIYMHDGSHIPYNRIIGFNLEIGVPNNLTYSSKDELHRIQEYGYNKGVRVIIAEIP